ncbi:MAG: deoxyribonuclease IV [Actinomycetota bacterium]
MIVGAHIRTRGGLPSVVPGALAIGAEGVQFFASNARMWRPPSIPDEAAARFREECAAESIRSAFLHAPYLVNIASPNPEFHAKSIVLSRATLEAADALGAAGLVVHAGAGGRGEPREALARAANALDAIGTVDVDANLVVELMAGSSGAVASTFAEAARLFEATSSGDRLRLCIDTCHLFAAGYALDEPAGVEECFAELGESGLADRLVAVHANDAEFPRGSRRDRHTNIGAGGIGLDGFAAILGRPEVRRCTVLCETPGDEDTRRRDVSTLRELADAGEAGG